MSVKVLFWYEGNTQGPNYARIDGDLACFGAEPHVIDTLGAFKGAPGQFPVPHKSLGAALAALRDHAWVFLDATGTTILDELVHPPTPVVYVVGSNLNGFDQDVASLPGQVVRLRKPAELWDHQVISQVLYDRYLFEQGRRK